MDSSDCDELPEGTLARIQSQELLDQSLEGDAIQIGDDRERKVRIIKSAQNARRNQINKSGDDCGEYDHHRVQVDNYNLSDDEANDDDIDDDVDPDDDENHGHGKFTQTVKDLTLSSNNVRIDYHQMSIGFYPNDNNNLYLIHDLDFFKECRRINDINHDHIND